MLTATNLTTETVPQVCCRNHSGLFFRLMLTTSKGTCVASRVRMVRWAYGQNLAASRVRQHVGDYHCDLML